MNPPKPSRGEIWLVDWTPGRGAEQTGRRPAVIVQNDFGNHSPTFLNTIAVPISTKGRDIPVHVRVPRSKTNGLKADSYVRCEQMLTIDKSRLLGKQWGRLTGDEMQKVDLALKRSLALS